MPRFFENLINPYASESLAQPPVNLGQFYKHYVRQISPQLATLFITSGLISIIGALLFVYIGVIVDELEMVPDEPAKFFTDNTGMLIWLAILVLIIDPLVAGVHLAILNLSISPSFTAMVRWQNHRYVLRQSMSFFQDDFAGRIANKVAQTGNSMRMTVTEAVDAVWYVAVFVASSMVILTDFDWRLGCALGVWLVVYLSILRHFVPKVMVRSAKMSDANSILIGRLVDSYTNIQTVKLFGQSKDEDTYGKEGIEGHRVALRNLLANIGLLDFLIGIVNGIFLTALAALCLWLWSIGELSVGSIAATFALVMRLNTMSFWMMFVSTHIAENVGMVRDGMDTISKPQEIIDQSVAAPLAVSSGAIEYDNISFNYGDEAEGEKPVIDNLSLSVKAGEKVGLVGRSGAGKSTLVQLLLRFYDVAGGTVSIDGQSVATVGQESLRGNISVVTQDTSLLHRSVIENIRYGQSDATLEDVVRAAKRAHAHDFIVGLSDPDGRSGYDAHVGERGVKLSGGQRQRIAIARVLLKNAPILVLDEATSALDSEVEAAIQEQLFDLMEGKTVIAIAHRLSTIAAMDRLVIMDQGRIIEQGSHAELIEQGGLYAQLWARQSQGFVAMDEEPQSLAGQ